MTLSGVRGSNAVQRTTPNTFSISRIQSEEVAAVVGFIHSYDRRDLKDTLSYVDTRREAGQSPITASDCDYRRKRTEVYALRAGFVRWLKRRFLEHDRLTIRRIFDQNPVQPVGVVGVEYARRTNDTLRKLGFRNGIVPQVGQKVPFLFDRGVPKLAGFGLASIGAPTPNPECALVAARG
jgi:hypothetical protein